MADNKRGEPGASGALHQEQSSYICLDEEICLEALAPLALSSNDLFVCRDRAQGDEIAANLALQCRLKVI